MNNSKNHQKLVDDILFAFGSRPDVRVWKRVVGFDRLKNIAYGLKGEPDIQGLISPDGRCLFIEVKTGNGKLSEDQKTFRRMAEKFGALYIEARSVEQAIADFNLLY